jgi:WD40 repeat protein
MLNATLPPLIGNAKVKPSSDEDNIHKFEEAQKLEDSSLNKESQILKGIEDIAVKAVDKTALKEQRLSFPGFKKGKSKGHTKSVLCVTSLGFAGRDTLVISGGEGKMAHVWSLKAGLHITSLEGHIQRISAVASYVDPTEGPLAITASWDESIRIWNLSNCYSLQPVLPSDIRSINAGASASSPSLLHANRVLSLAVVHCDNKPAVLVSGSADNSIKVWGLPAGDYLYELRDKECVTYYYALDSYNFNGQSFIVSGCRDNTVKVWALTPPRDNTDSKEGYARSLPSRVIEGHPSRIHTLAVVDTGALKQSGTAGKQGGTGTKATVVTACKDLVIRVFSLSTGSLLRVMTGAHSAFITSVAALVIPSMNEAFVVSASETGNICVWKYSIGEKERFFNGHTESCTCVHATTSPVNKHDLLIVSGSLDMSVRTWLLVEEASVVVREFTTRLLSLDIYCDGADKAVVFTGCEKGGLQSENLLEIVGSGSDASNGAFPTCWHVTAAHTARVRTVSVYAPNVAKNSHAYSVPSSARIDLSKPLVISGGRGKKIRLTSVDDGRNLLGENVYLEGHTSVVTSSAVFEGRMWKDALGIEREQLPFIVSGSEDNTVKLWALHSGECTHTFCGHELDVLAVNIFVPTLKKKTRKTASGRSTPMTGTSGDQDLALSRGAKRNMEREALLKPNVPVILSSGVDNCICIWSYDELLEGLGGEDADALSSDGEEIAEFSAAASVPVSRHLVAKLEATTHFNCVAGLDTRELFDPAVGPVVVAGGGDGGVHVWSLWPPYTKVVVLTGHTDEVQCICSLNTTTGHGPIIATGSWDKTVRIWSLRSMQCIRVVEGHSQEITAVRMYYPAGGDPALATVSGDCQLRVLNDCLGGVPKVDFVTEQFYLDLKTKDKPRTRLNEIINWPRINMLVEDAGAEAFFSQFYTLFCLAVKLGASEFVIEYFPQCTLALLKTNVPFEATYQVTGDEGEVKSEKHTGSLLHHCMRRRDIRSTRVIVASWIDFLNTAPVADTDLLYDDRANVEMDDLLLLAETFPKEFERFICHLNLVPWKTEVRPSGDFKYFVEQAKHALELKHHSKIDEEKKDVSAAMLFIPVKNLCHIDLLKCYSKVCENLDSVSIFDSDAGQLALSYAWNDAGLRVHAISMIMYLLKVLLTTFSIYTFDRSIGTDFQWVSMVIVIVLVLLDTYFMYNEFFEFVDAPFKYMTGIWNVIIGVVIISGLVGNVLRLALVQDTLVSRTALSITAIFMWSNVLYYLRAFEATGPLVSMVLRISRDMQPFLLILMLCIVGFSQAFWLISNEQPNELDDDPPYRTIASSLLYSFSSTLGDFNPEAFVGMPLERFGILLTCAFILTSSILLLNLLIALMGDSYGAVKEKGLAQWRLEQADLIIESSSRMTVKERENERFIFLRKKTDDIDEDIVKNQFNLPNEVRRMKSQLVELKTDLQHIGLLTELVQSLNKKVDRIETAIEES